MSEEHAQELAYGDADGGADLRPMSEGGRPADTHAPGVGELLYCTVAPSEKAAAKRARAERLVKKEKRSEETRRDESREVQRKQDAEARSKITDFHRQAAA